MFFFSIKLFVVMTVCRSSRMKPEKGRNQSPSSLKGAFVHPGLNLAFIFRPHTLQGSQTNPISTDNHTNIQSGVKVLQLLSITELEFRGTV